MCLYFCPNNRCKFAICKNYHFKSTYKGGGLTTLFSIFFFFMYLFIHPNVCFYILMIHKWSKIRKEMMLKVYVKEFQSPKNIENNHYTNSLDFVLLLEFHFPCRVCCRSPIHIACISFALSIAILMVFSNTFGSMWYVWLISAINSIFQYTWLKHS